MIVADEHDPGSGALLAGCRVLVVEDDYFIADDLAEFFEAAGAKLVGPVGHLDRAVGLAKGDGFDIAVLDINLHGEMSFAIADELMRQNVPFVFATGYMTDVIPPRFMHVMRWAKPYDMSALVRDIGRLCPRFDCSEHASEP